MTNIAIRTLESNPLLGTLADAVQPVVRDTLQKSGALKDLLHGVWLGHPLHPVLTDIPVGAWTAAAICDAVELMGNEKLSDAGDFSVAVGLVGALGSAITGAADWSETDGRAKKIGMAHALLNVVATGCYATALAMRRGKSRRAGIGLSLLGYAIASSSAYLGGHLVFGEQVGVDHTATPDRGQPQQFLRVANESELQERVPKRVMAGNVAIVLVKSNGTIHALTETCSHMGGPLSEGKLDGDGIRCPWHGSRFCLTDGSVLDGPATSPAPTFEVRVVGGMIEVRANDIP
jgi:nitrite reductase/ring-hydroxylating ferredoxin subunit/uncharacterized membrane protein